MASYQQILLQKQKKNKTKTKTNIKSFLVKTEP